MIDQYATKDVSDSVIKHFSLIISAFTSEIGIIYIEHD